MTVSLTVFWLLPGDVDQAVLNGGGFQDPAEQERRVGALVTALTPAVSTPSSSTRWRAWFLPPPPALGQPSRKELADLAARALGTPAPPATLAHGARAPAPGSACPGSCSICATCRRSPSGTTGRTLGVPRRLDS